MRYTSSTLSANIEYLSNNDEGRHIPCCLKQLAFEAMLSQGSIPAQIPSPLADTVEIPDYYADLDELEEDYQVFAADIEAVCAEAKGEGLTGRQVNKVLCGWARLAKREGSVAQ